MKAKNINRYLESIINTMNDGLVVVSPDGSILMINKAFETLTGYSEEDVLGKPCTLLGCDACELHVKSEKGEAWWCALFNPDHEDMKRCRCNFKGKDGIYFPVLKNALFDCVYKRTLRFELLVGILLLAGLFLGRFLEVALIALLLLIGSFMRLNFSWKD